MLNWKLRKLSDIAEFNPQESIKKGELAKKVAMEKLIPHCKQIPSYEVSAFNGGTKFRNGDTIMARITPCLENGKISKVDILDTNEIGFGSTEYIIFRAINNVSDPDYLYYLVTSPLVKEPAIKSMVGSSGRQRVQTDVVKNLEVNLPPLEIQQKIAKVLSTLDDKISINNFINNNLEQQAQAIFKSWFVDFEPFGGVMPDDWVDGVLADIVEFINGYAFKSSELLNTPDDNCYDVFKQGHINRGGGFNINGTKSWYPKEIATNLDKYILKKGDILMAMTDMKDNVAILGNTALMEVDDKYIVNQRVGLLKCKNNIGISYPYVYILTNSNKFLTDLRKRANSGVQVNLSSTEIKNSEIKIAPKEINQKFDNITRPLFEQIFNKDIENQKLAQLRDTLLPKLMSGEIDVSNVEIDEVLTNKLSFSRTIFVCFGLKIKIFILVLKDKNNNLHLIVNFSLFYVLNYNR